MSITGPVPKRDDERIRRNVPEVPTTKVEVIGDFTPQPELGFPDPHPIVRDFWESLPGSAQCRFYEPSDWQFARLALHFCDKLLKSEKPNGQLLSVVTSMLSELLVSEGSRRRVRMEIERKPSTDEQQVVLSAADRFRSRLMGQ